MSHLAQAVDMDKQLAFSKGNAQLLANDRELLEMVAAVMGQWTGGTQPEVRRLAYDQTWGPKELSQARA